MMVQKSGGNTLKMISALSLIEQVTKKFIFILHLDTELDKGFLLAT
jgi:hypothetical protein